MQHLLRASTVTATSMAATTVTIKSSPTRKRAHVAVRQEKKSASSHISLGGF